MSVKEENITRFIYAMFNMMHSFKKGVDQCSAACGDLSEKEFVIVNYIGQQQNAKMSEIAQNLSAPMSTITSIVDKLVENKYLNRFNSNDDRRVVLVTLASNGKETFDTFNSFKQDIAKRILTHFDEKDQENLIQYLEKIPAIL